MKKDTIIKLLWITNTILAALLLLGSTNSFVNNVWKNQQVLIKTLDEITFKGINGKKYIRVAPYTIDARPVPFFGDKKYYPQNLEKMKGK